MANCTVYFFLWLNTGVISGLDGISCNHNRYTIYYLVLLIWYSYLLASFVKI